MKIIELIISKKKIQLRSNCDNERKTSSTSQHFKCKTKGIKSATQIFSVSTYTENKKRTELIHWNWILPRNAAAIKEGRWAASPWDWNRARGTVRPSWAGFCFGTTGVIGGWGPATPTPVTTTTNWTTPRTRLRFNGIGTSGRSRGSGTCIWTTADAPTLTPWRHWGRRTWAWPRSSTASDPLWWPRPSPPRMWRRKWRIWVVGISCQYFSISGYDFLEGLIYPVSVATTRWVRDFYHGSFNTGSISRETNDTKLRFRLEDFVGEIHWEDCGGGGGGGAGNGLLIQSHLITTAAILIWRSMDWVLS